MNQSTSAGTNGILMALLGTATLGVFAIAFSSTKTGNQFQKRLIALAGRFNSKPGRSDPLDVETVQAMFI